jgi:hypothetical protein
MQLPRKLRRLKTMEARLIEQGFEPLVDENEAAKMRGEPVRTLQAERSKKVDFCPYIKRGKSVLYKPSDVRDFIERHRIAPLLPSTEEAIAG